MRSASQDVPFVPRRVDRLTAASFDWETDSGAPAEDSHSGDPEPRTRTTSPGAPACRWRPCRCGRWAGWPGDFPTRVWRRRWQAGRVRFGLDLSALAPAAGAAGRLAVEDPAAHGFIEDQRWSLARVGDLITARYRMRYTLRGVSMLLHRMGPVRISRLSADQTQRERGHQLAAGGLGAQATKASGRAWSVDLFPGRRSGHTPWPPKASPRPHVAAYR